MSHFCHWWNFNWEGPLPSLVYAYAPSEENKKGVSKFSASFLAFSNEISTVQKIVLSSSREQGNFREIEASRPRPRTWSFEAKAFKMCPRGQRRPRGQHLCTEAPVTSVNVLTSYCNCKSFCSFRCACKSRSIKCTGLCSCNYENCNTVDARSETIEAAPSQRNVFNFLEALQ